MREVTASGIPVQKQKNIGVTVGANITSAKTPPRISKPLRLLFEKMAIDIDIHIDAMICAIREEVPAYGAITDPGLIDEVRSMTRINLEVWHRTLLDERAPTEEDLAPVSAFACRRYHQGVPLTDLLHSFRVGATVAWQQILLLLADDERILAEMLMKVSPYLLQHTDHLGQALSSSYISEAHRNLQWRDRRHQELCALILDSPDDTKRFQTLTNELQIDPNGRRAALVIEPSSVADRGAFERQIEELQQKVSEHLHLGQEAPHTYREGRLILWVPISVGTKPVLEEQALAIECCRLTRVLSTKIRSIGLGLFRSEALGWHASAEQALSALEWGCRKTGSDDVRVFKFTDVILQDAVVCHRACVGYFDELLGVLADEPILVVTLKTWLSTPGLTRKKAAATLNIHPNTLNYRLQKIEQKLGANLSDLSWLARLFVAFRLRDRG
ncbi:PucR family transcriptional regulator [Marinobacter sediminicola]|uniref:PucR family transcriptional regulator n=1 Tax=Marinobacter sediminicola TaxID=3072994 RepID=UPI0028111311|nr:helix-turn-helix domain-containing protein [Marinobacter sp. F26243]